MKHTYVLLSIQAILLAACASSTPVQLTTASKSQFDGAVYSGETVTLEKPTLGAEIYRVFQQGSTGFVSIQSLRSETEEMATRSCDRKGKSMRGITETAAKPPFMFGNFPRVELVLECADKAVAGGAVTDGDKYEKLAALKKLLDGGALTQQEFEREKAKVLAMP